MRRTVSAVSARESAHADQASQEAVRPPVLPTPRSLSLTPSFTIPPYRKSTARYCVAATRSLSLTTPSLPGRFVMSRFYLLVVSKLLRTLSTCVPY